MATTVVAPSASAAERETAEIDLLPFVIYLLGRKRRVMVHMLVATLIGLAVSLLWPASYSATTEILPPQQRPSGASAMLSEMSAGAAALASAGTEFQARSAAETYVHMIQARPVLDGLISRFGLMNVYHRRYQLDTRKALLSHSKIVASKEGFVRVTVEDRDRERAAAIANAYVEQLRELTKHLALTESSQRRVFYEGQLTKSKDELAGAEIAFKRMQQAKGVISLDAQARSMIEGAAQLRAQIAAKEVELERLRGFATGNNPQVQGAEDEVRALQGELSRAEARNGGGYTGMSLSGVPAAELEFVRASRELRYQESVYELLMKQYEMARMDEARDAPNVQVLEVASPAERASWPKKSVLLPVFALLGLLVGCGGVALDYWTSRLSAERCTEVQAIRSALWGWRR